MWTIIPFTGHHILAYDVKSRYYPLMDSHHWALEIDVWAITSFTSSISTTWTWPTMVTHCWMGVSEIRLPRGCANRLSGIAPGQKRILAASLSSGEGMLLLLELLWRWILHTGQVVCRRSHESMQLTWKVWPHAGKIRRMSWSSYSSRQITHL